MTPALSALALTLALGSPADGPSILVQPAHGCHQTWQRGGRGLHRHGPDCALREGLADRQKRRDKSKRKADTSA